MAWSNNIFLLKKIIEIQELTLMYKAKGYTQAWVYRNHVKDKYFISIATFQRYMARNAKKELREIEQSNLGIIEKGGN